MNQRLRKPETQQRRRGVAAVEFAVCLPLFVLLTAGAIQVTDAIYLKNSLRVTAYEAARVAVETGSDNEDALERANEILTARNVQEAQITFDPDDVTDAEAGQPITITVTAPANSNTVMPNWFFTDQVIRSKMVMSRE